MKTFLTIASLAATILVSATGFAQTPAAPTGSTGICWDGTYTNTPSKKGACAGHKGVKDWFGQPTAAAPVKAATPATPAKPAAAASATKSTSMPTSAVPGGGAGQVWANAGTKVYHCQKDKWYGKTKHGTYMSEAEAKAKGFHPDHGKSCQ